MPGSGLGPGDDILAHGQILPSWRGLSSGTYRSTEAGTTDCVKCGRRKYRQLIWEWWGRISGAVRSAYSTHCDMPPFFSFFKINIVKDDSGE